MSRRDTIIVAVLMNTGLLAALFMMAIHTDAPFNASSSDKILSESISIETQPISEEFKAPEYQREQVVVASRDEIDEVLKNYSMTNSQPVVITPDRRQERTGETPKINHVPRTGYAPEEEYVEVKVKKGDYLEKIARANGTTVSVIMRANHLINAKIDVGQTLRIPVVKKNEALAKKPQTQMVKEVAINEPQYYTIKNGDNPWKIAKEFRVRFDELLKLNDLDENKARNLKPGDVLRVK